MNIECPACDKKYNIPDEKLNLIEKSVAGETIPFKISFGVV